MQTAHSVLFSLVAGDVLAVRREVAEMLPGMLGRSYADIRTEIGSPARSRGGLTVHHGVALINITGPITRTENICSGLFGGTSIDGLRAQLREALASEEAESIVFFVDSPGGSAAGVDDLAEEIYAARAVKPTYAYVDSMGASAAYWLATAAETVMVSRTGYVGSVGAYALYPAKGAGETLVIGNKSPRKVPDPATEDGYAQIRAHVDEVVDFFIAGVAKFRGVSVATVEAEFGQGDIVIAAEAVARGMADGIGTYDQVVKRAASDAGRLRLETTPGTGDLNTIGAHEQPAGGAAEAAKARIRTFLVKETLK